MYWKKLRKNGKSSLWIRRWNPCKKYDMLLTEDSTLFDEIALELMPVFIRDNEYEIHPVWAFRGQIQVEDWGSSDIELFFDGFSGKEITS